MIQISLGLAIPRIHRPALPTVAPESIGPLNPSDEQMRYWYHTVDRIWFVPVTDRSGRRIEPVYVTVRGSDHEASLHPY